MDSVPHSCITRILIDSLATWNFRKKALTLFLNVNCQPLAAVVNSYSWPRRCTGSQTSTPVPLPPASVDPEEVPEEAAAVQRTQHSLLLIESQKGN